MADISLADLPQQIALALSLASSSTGADIDYLMQTAHRESGFQVDAKAQSSSATGLFQFIEETWIRTIKEEGGRLGLAVYADKIKRSEAGKYYVPDPTDRQLILDLRKDPQVSALMAGAYARRNGDFLATEIGRKPTAGELYIAHFLGPIDAARLIRLRGVHPDLSAPDLFEKAAASNGAIFYSAGKPRSVGQVYELLIRKHQSTPAAETSLAAIGSADGPAAIGTWSTDVQKVVSAADIFPTFGRLDSGGGWGAQGSAKKPVDAAVTEGWGSEVAVGGAPAAVTTTAAKIVQPAQIQRTAAALALRGTIEGEGTAALDAGGMASAQLASAADVLDGSSPPRLKVIRVK
jgi:hypothetical protein